MNLAANAGLNVLLKKAYGMKGGLVGLAGSSAGLLAEILCGTGTTASNLDNISVLYDYMCKFMGSYSYTINQDQSVSAECKAFGEIYFGEMKMAGISWVGELNKNSRKESCDVINESLNRSIETIVAGIR